MKKSSFAIMLICSALMLACKKKYNCYVQDKDSKTIDTIRCECDQSTISELENTPYVIKDTVYTISCQKE